MAPWVVGRHTGKPIVSDRLEQGERFLNLGGMGGTETLALHFGGMLGDLFRVFLHENLMDHSCPLMIRALCIATFVVLRIARSRIRASRATLCRKTHMNVQQMVQVRWGTRVNPRAIFDGQDRSTKKALVYHRSRHNR